MMRLHATCVALPDPSAAEGVWAGVLLLGASGAGKSDLALRLIDAGARLVADDQVLLRAEEGQLLAAAPEPLKGLIEIRGVGIVRVDAADDVPVRLVCEAVSVQGERLPPLSFWTQSEVAIAKVSLDFTAPSAGARVRAALKAVRLGLFAA